MTNEMQSNRPSEYVHICPVSSKQFNVHQLAVGYYCSAIRSFPPVISWEYFLSQVWESSLPWLLCRSFHVVKSFSSSTFRILLQSPSLCSVSLFYHQVLCCVIRFILCHSFLYGISRWAALSSIHTTELFSFISYISLFNV